MDKIKLKGKEYLLELKHKFIKRLEMELGYGMQKFYMNPTSISQSDATCVVWASMIDSDMSYDDFLDALDESEIAIDAVYNLGISILTNCFSTQKKTKKPELKIPTEKKKP
jgi:hypothetical protein